MDVKTRRRQTQNNDRKWASTFRQCWKKGRHNDLSNYLSGKKKSTEKRSSFIIFSAFYEYVQFMRLILWREYIHIDVHSCRNAQLSAWNSGLRLCFTPYKCERERKRQALKTFNSNYTRNGLCLFWRVVFFSSSLCICIYAQGNACIPYCSLLLALAYVRMYVYRSAHTVHIEHTLRSIQLHSFCYHFKVDFFWCDDLTCIQPIENFKLLMLIHVIQCASNRYEFWLFKNVSGKNKMRRERGGKKIVFNILECNIIFTATTCSTVIVWFYRVPRP